MKAAAAWDEFWEQSAGEGRGLEALADSLRRSTAGVPNGFYTITFPDGSHKTFRIHTQNPKAKFAPGKRVISLLIGPDNTLDYEMVGFLAEAGPQPWKRHRDTRVGVYLDMLWDLANGEHLEGCSLEVSKRCLLCNRPLTDPESIDRGIGPLCWERMGHE